VRAAILVDGDRHAQNNFTNAGCAVAARSLGYARAVEMIVDEQMTPERIARLFASSASKNAGRDVALIVLAGSVARYKAQPQDWSAEIERSLANKVAGPDFRAISEAAAKLVAKHWTEIERGANDAGAGL